MKKIKPTGKELSILKMLWEKEPATVREIHEKLHPHDETGYTTTLKLMQIMFDKGLLNRKKEGKSHLYFTTVTETTVKSDLLDKFIQTVFNGSKKSMLMQLLGDSKTSQKEIDEIREYLNQSEIE